MTTGYLSGTTAMPVKSFGTTALPVANRSAHPFLRGVFARLESPGTPAVYGVNHPGSGAIAKYAKFAQTLSGNKAFKLPADITTANILQTTGGAVSTANQLRTVVLVDGVPQLHSRADQVAPAGGFVMGAGGGTAVADATLSVKGTTAANLLAGSTLLSVASSGADTQTLLVGDIITFASHATVYRVTATTATLNGTTEVNVAITPPLTQAVIAGDVVTVATSDDRTVLLGTAPAVGAKVEVMVFASTDIVTVSAALVAGVPESDKLYDFMCASSILTMSRLA